MEEIDFKTRKLIICSFSEDVEPSSFADQSHAILVETDNTLDNQMIERLDKFADRNCAEICCFGMRSEEYHDYIDGVIEDKGLLGIVTTSLSSETAKDVAEYFVCVSGGIPPLLIAYIENVELINVLRVTIDNDT